MNLILAGTVLSILLLSGSLGIGFPYIEAKEQLNPAIQLQLEWLSKQIEKLEKKPMEFRVDEIGSLITQFRMAGENILELKDHEEANEQLQPLKQKYEELLTLYKKLAIKNEQKNPNLSASQKDLLKQLKINEVQYYQKILNDEIEQKQNDFVKSEINKLRAVKEFRVILREFFIKDARNGLSQESQSRIVDQIIEKLTNDQNWEVLAVVLDLKAKHIKDSKVTQKIKKDKKKILSIIEQINNQNIPVQSEPTDTPTESPPEPTDTPTESPPEPTDTPTESPPSTKQEKQSEKEERKEQKESESEERKESKSKEDDSSQ